ncbi:MAG: PAS domain-containing protein [Paracoccaceae bacterium]|nr:PAS domain-containing protein [Paracoccaceae bacterium]
MISTFFGKGTRPPHTCGGSADSDCTKPDNEARKKTAELRAYWEALRQGGLPPLRTEIDPRGIEGVLAEAFLIERIAPGVARFRIAGMHLADMMGMDVRGMPISACFDPDARAVLAAALEQVFNGPALLEMALSAERGLGRPALSARLLVLPLRRATGETDLALGCIASFGTIGRTPRRFAAESRVITPLTLPPVAQSCAQTPQPAPGFAENVAAFCTPSRAVPPRAAPGRTHLRLISTND